MVSKAWKTNPNAETDKDEKNKIELSMQGKEKVCELCGMENHILDKCFNYDKKKSMEENRKIYAAKLEEKKRKKTRRKEKKKVRDQVTTNTEPSGLCRENDANLYCEPC